MSDAPRFRKEDVEVILAGNEYGPAIGALADANDFDPFEDQKVDWSEVYPSWLVALYESKVIGAIQTSPTKPVGRVELLFLWPELPKKLKAVAVRRLLHSAYAILQAQGLQGAIGVVPFELVGYKRVLERHFGAVEMDDGWSMLVRFSDERTKQQEQGQAPGSPSD